MRKYSHSEALARPGKYEYFYRDVGRRFCEVTRPGIGRWDLGHTMDAGGSNDTTVHWYIPVGNVPRDKLLLLVAKPK